MEEQSASCRLSLVATRLLVPLGQASLTVKHSFMNKAWNGVGGNCSMNAACHYACSTILSRKTPRQTNNGLLNLHVWSIYPRGSTDILRKDSSGPKSSRTPS